jgi:hypothetical protein
MVKQIAAARNGDRVLLSNLPPLRVGEGVTVLGRVVCVVEPRGIIRRILRWAFSEELAAADSESEKFTVSCTEKVREIHGVEQPAFPTWEPQRVRWAQ